MSHHKIVGKSPIRAAKAGIGREIELDATGLLCPLPVLKIRKRMRSLVIGDVLRVEADDPASAIDVPHYCSESGHLLLGQEEIGSRQVFRIRKS